MDPLIFDPEIDISPFELFRRLKEAEEDERPVLVDLRPRPTGLVLAGSIGGGDDDRPWPADREVILIDGDGRQARRRAKELRASGRKGVRALFGGIELYDFALDPAVVGEERFLERGHRRDR